MLPSLLPWLVVTLLLGVVVGIIIGVLLASMTAKGHYTHFMNHTQPLRQSSPTPPPYDLRSEGYDRNDPRHPHYR